jgi:hypothetical protein
MIDLENGPTRKPLTCFIAKKIGHIIKDCHVVLLQKSRLNSNPT